VCSILQYTTGHIFASASWKLVNPSLGSAWQFPDSEGTYPVMHNKHLPVDCSHELGMGEQFKSHTKSAPPGFLEGFVVGTGFALGFALGFIAAGLLSGFVVETGFALAVVILVGFITEGFLKGFMVATGFELGIGLRFIVLLIPIDWQVPLISG